MWFVKESSYNSLKDECARLQEENATLRDTISDIQDARTALLHAKRDEEVEEKSLPYIMPYDEFEEFLNPEPKEPDHRVAYMAQIAGYFYGGLQDYLKYTASNFKNELARFPVTEREADFYRASINVCYLLLEWGDRCISEHHANIAGEKGSVDAFNTEPIENIKRAIK